MTEVQSINTSNMEIENMQQESQSKLLTVKSINNIDDLQTIIFDLGSYNYRIGYSGNDRPSFIFPPTNLLRSSFIFISSGPIPFIGEIEPCKTW